MYAHSLCHPAARREKGGQALRIGICASFVGGIVSLPALFFAAPTLAGIALTIFVTKSRIAMLLRVLIPGSLLASVHLSRRQAKAEAAA